LGRCQESTVIKYLVLATLPLLPMDDTDNDNSIMDYQIYQNGPRTVYEGAAKLKWDENVNACVEYTFDLVPGRLAGSAISSDPGQPMLPFDEVLIFDDEIYVSWERNRTDLWDTPTECHRRFYFFVIKTEFNADDLGKLLSDWGPPRLIDNPWPEPDSTYVSPWDLNLDTVVDGKDLAILLAGWKID